jgi:hypothetical protein
VTKVCALLVVFGSVLVVAVWTLPAILNRQPTAGATSAERLVAINSTRTAMVTLLAATAALGTLLYTVRTYALSRTGQVTERYSTAVGQLGDDSPADQPAAVDVLSAFVRGAAARPDTGHPADDVQAALTVLGRRRRTASERPLNLRGSNLRGIDMQRADLRGARLDGADLTGASLIEADLRLAVLCDATLDRAKLIAVRLEDATMSGASLRGADLYRAHLLAEQLSDEQLRTCRSIEHLVRCSPDVADRVGRP